MSYERKWKLLADLLTQLRERGQEVPADVLNDLRSAKTMIQVLKADPTDIESISRIDTYLRTVESYAIFTMEKEGKENVEKWLKKLEAPERVENCEKGMVISKFVTRVPRNENWMRIKISDDIHGEEIRKLVEEEGLSCRLEKNKYIIVYGEKKKIKSLVKRLAEQYSGSRNG